MPAQTRHESVLFHRDSDAVLQALRLTNGQPEQNKLSWPLRCSGRDKLGRLRFPCSCVPSLRPLKSLPVFLSYYSRSATRVRSNAPVHKSEANGNPIAFVSRSISVSAARGEGRCSSSTGPPPILPSESVALHLRAPFLSRNTGSHSCRRATVRSALVARRAGR